MFSLTTTAQANVVEALGLDKAEEIKDYVLDLVYFEVKGHPVMLCISVDGEVEFTVDGVVELDHIPPLTGAIILRRLLKEWWDMAARAERNHRDVELFCNPVDSDGGLLKRTKMFEKAGFVYSGGSMFYEHPWQRADREAVEAARQAAEDDIDRERYRRR